MYAGDSGAEEAFAKLARREPSVENALAITVGRLLKLDEDEAALFVYEQIERCLHFDDEEYLASRFGGLDRSADQNKQQDLMLRLRGSFEDPSPSLRVRFVCAGLVEKQFGADERAEYILAVVKGQAS